MEGPRRSLRPHARRFVLAGAVLGYAALVIGKPLSARLSFGPLSSDDATRLAREVLRTHAAPIVEVRRKGAGMVVVCVLRADGLTLRVCKNLGFDLRRGSSAVFGVLGEEAARAFPELGEARLGWLAEPSGPRQTKLLVLSGGFALVAVEAEGSAVSVTHVEP